MYAAHKGENRYALKEIPISQFEVSPDDLQADSRTPEEEICQQVCKEVAILKDIDHPNIVKYYTSFVDSENVYIVMELLDGSSLADFILS